MKKPCRHKWTFLSIEESSLSLESPYYCVKFQKCFKCGKKNTASLTYSEWEAEVARRSCSTCFGPLSLHTTEAPLECITLLAAKIVDLEKRLSNAKVEF